jgi:hypothetical protein
VVVHVVAHSDAVADPSRDAAAQHAALDGRPPRRRLTKPLVQLTLAEALRDDDPRERAAARPGAMMGGALLPGPITRRAALAATVKTVVHPGASPPEPRYVPSAALADFVRCRDLTCRFPGCDHPADRCDVDHTIPHPIGPTCASNLKCVCRFHHLLTTFWGGFGDWRDRQLPDGTVIWTSPGGQTYRTRPGSRLLFPSLCEPTAPVAAVLSQAKPSAGLTMPRRNVTRSQDRQRRIDDERRLNEADAAEAALRSVPPF